jgi:hypothetical protein
MASSKLGLKTGKLQTYPTEVLSSDACRAMVSDDENNQAVTNEAFALLHHVAAQRLALGRPVAGTSTFVRMPECHILSDLFGILATKTWHPGHQNVALWTLSGTWDCHSGILSSS